MQPEYSSDVLSEFFLSLAIDFLEVQSLNLSSKPFSQDEQF